MIVKKKIFRIFLSVTSYTNIILNFFKFKFNSIRLLAIIFLFLMAWSFFSHVEQVVNARGQVIAFSKNQIIQASESGLVEEIIINEGDLVSAGDLLARLNPEKSLASYNETYNKIITLEISRLRVLSELNNKNFIISNPKYSSFNDIVNNQLVLFKKRRKSFLDQHNYLKKNLAILNDELNIYRKLHVLGDVSSFEMLKIEKQFNESNAALLSHENKYNQDLQSELNKIDEELSIINNILIQKKEVLSASNIFSPVDGFVKNIKVNTIGGVLKPGDVLLEIVPTQSGLLVEAKISPSKIGLIKVGQKVNIKFDSYDYSIYGALKGNISYISPDSISDLRFDQSDDKKFYRVNIDFDKNSLDNPKFKNLQLIPGLTVSLDINIGKRSIISIILKPVVKTINESFSL